MKVKKKRVQSWIFEGKVGNFFQKSEKSDSGYDKFPKKLKINLERWFKPIFYCQIRKIVFCLLWCVEFFISYILKWTFIFCGLNFFRLNFNFFFDFFIVEFNRLKVVICSFWENNGLVRGFSGDIIGMALSCESSELTLWLLTWNPFDTRGWESIIEL